LLEQYKLYLTSAENISNRRQTANAFFVTVNTVIISLISYLNLGVPNSSKFYWLASIAGIAISFMWYRLVKSYKDLNTAKFKVVHEIEKSLPISPYDAEWEAVGRGQNPKLYLPFTHIEVYVPWVFLILHFIVLGISTYSNLKQFIGSIVS
jgi:amino acid permease